MGIGDWGLGTDWKEPANERIDEKNQREETKPVFHNCQVVCVSRHSLGIMGQRYANISDSAKKSLKK